MSQYSADVTHRLATIFIAARRRASAVHAVVVCLFVRLSQLVGVLLKRLNAGSGKQRHTIVQGLWFYDAEDLGKTQTGSPQRRRQMQAGYVKIGEFRQITIAITRKCRPLQAFTGKFITLSVHICLQHVCRDAERRAGSSATG